MAGGDLTELRQPFSGKQGQRSLGFFSGGPQPIKRAINRPTSVVRLVEIETIAQHTGAEFPACDERGAVWFVEWRIAKNCKTLRMCQYRFDRLLIRIRIPTCWWV